MKQDNLNVAIAINAKGPDVTLFDTESENHDSHRHG